MIPYIPKTRSMQYQVLDCPTAWSEVAPVVEDILDRFHVDRNLILEFGVDYGYSASVFANFFRWVYGVDTFMGDPMAGDRGPNGIHAHVLTCMGLFSNVSLIKSDFRDWIRLFNNTRWDLIHVDIVHTYAETFECGSWAVEHSPIVLFHDTVAFPEVMRAVEDISARYSLNFYHLAEKHGVGILTRRTPDD